MDANQQPPTVTNKEEEEAVLATLQASLHDQQVYEENVIRQATHALAPPLPTLGLPSLQGLHPHRTGPAAATHHVYELLRQVRAQQQQEEEVATASPSSSSSDLAYLKEQLLLTYLAQVSGAEGSLDLVDPPNQERREERRRKRLQKDPPSADSSKLLAALDTHVDVVGPADPQSKRRKVQRITNDEEDPVQREAQQRQRVLERRQARRARRQEDRRRQETYDDEEEEEEEAEWINDNSSHKPVLLLSKENNDLAPEAVAAAQSDMAVSTLLPPLSCPLCLANIETTTTTTSGDDPVARDSVLAAHMQSCQQATGRRSRRGTAAPRSLTLGTTTTLTTAAPATRRRAVSQQGRARLAKRVAAPRAAPPLDDLEEWAYEDRVDDWIEHGLSRMKEMKERVDDGVLAAVGDDGLWQDYGNGLWVPAWIHRRLFGYQREGLKWMWGLQLQGCGGCLGDEMGLGKTVSVSSFLGILAANRKLKSALIVVPATMLQHWLKELAVWAPGLRRILLHTSGEMDGNSRAVSPQRLRVLSKWLAQARKDRLYEAIDAEDEESNPLHSFCGTGYAVLTTYENVRRNPDVYVGHSWTYVVLDEAQKIRNPEADVTMAMKRLRTPNRICMTGTPIQNDFSELWSIFDFCFPSRLGTLPAFQQELADPIKRGGYSNASPMQVQLAYRCALVVRDLISPYLLRRQKKDIKEVAMMPSKTEHVLFCRLSHTQRSLYEAYLRSDDVVKVMRGSANLLGAITMMRKICNHPDLVCDPDSTGSLIQNGFNLTALNYNRNTDSEDDSDYDGNESMMVRSGKLEVLSKILPLWKKQGHRVLIFCQWKKMLNIIQQFVNLQGWKFGRLDGNTNVAARQRLVDTFNTDESYFGLLCTTRTGGVGLNLTGANRIILYDPDWNPQTDAQARERAWRFGQEKEVTIYRLITAGTVEEKIYQRQIFKTAMSNRVLQDPRQRRLFSQHDLRDLFTLKADTGSVRNGGEGLTQTAAHAQGIGIVDPEDDDAKDDNGDTLKTVMQSKGLAGVFDHHFVEHDTSRKSTTVREMEAKAKEVARAAVSALRQSVADNQANELQRFGAGGMVAGGASSKSLLANLRQRNSAISNEGPGQDNETQKYAKLLATLKEYVRRRRPTTDEILAEFESSVLKSDAAVFRRLLKTVAVLQSGQWRLK